MTLPRNLDSSFDRFKLIKHGGYFSNSTYKGSALNCKGSSYILKDKDALIGLKKIPIIHEVSLLHLDQQKQNFHVPKKVNPEDVPNGRPLWQIELKKVVPPPTSYNIKREFDKVDKHYKDDLEKAFAKNGCSFGVSHEKYKKVSWHAISDRVIASDLRPAKGYQDL